MMQHTSSALLVTSALLLASLLLPPAQATATATATAATGAFRKLRFTPADNEVSTGLVNTAHRRPLQVGPSYGNWCGLAYGSGTPIDAVDACCMDHDNCYGSRGYFDCLCDYNIVTCMSAVDTSNDANANLAKVGAIEFFRSSYNSRCLGGSYDYSG